jgi:hypothetical protein
MPGEVNIGGIGIGASLAGDLGPEGGTRFLLTAAVESSSDAAGLSLAGSVELNPDGSAGLSPGADPSRGPETGADLDLGAAVGSGVNIDAGISLGVGGEAGLPSVTGAAFGPEGEGLLLAVGADLRPVSATGLDLGVGIGSGPGVSVGTDLGFGGDEGLHLAIDVAHGSGGVGLDLGTDADPGLGGGPGVELGVGVDPDLDNFPSLGGGTSPGWNGGASPGKGLNRSPGNGGSAPGTADRPFGLGVFGFAPGRDGPQFDTITWGDSQHQTDGESSRHTQPLQLTESDAEEEAVGVADAIVVDLPPESVGLLYECTPFDALAPEQALDWLGNPYEELAGWWAGLGVPPWAFLALTVAAAAGEVARRNLRRWQESRVVDAVFHLGPVG